MPIWRSRKRSAYLALEEKEWYPKDPEDITLGGGYWDGGVLWGLREERDHSVTGVLRSALEKNYFEVEPAARELVRSVRGYVTQALGPGAEFVRARPGVKARLKKQNWLAMRKSPSFSYLPYSGAEIGAPPVSKVGAGRLNREHVSILYLASDAATAVAELRPHPGELVSTARFRLKDDIIVANLADHDIRNFLSDEKLETLRRILSLADVLNVPVHPGNRHLYSATQLLSDAFRVEGFDGVSFRSSVAPGTNFASFNPAAFEFVAGSEDACEVTALAYGIEAVGIQPSSYDKGEYEPDADDPLSTFVHGMTRRVQRH
jgi:hypothetical protein